MINGWKNSELGLIPHEWNVDTLSKYAEKPQYGFTDSASTSGNVKFLRITDITDTGVDWNSVPYCNCNDFEKYQLKNGDIVFARIGATTGKSYIINNPPLAVFASYLIRVRTKEELLPDFLIFYFNSEYYWSQINSQKGSNLKGGVNGSILSDLKVVVPPIPEQRKIAYILNTIQKAIEQQDKLIKTTTELRKALMQKLFTEGIKGEKQKQTEIGLVPESWELVKLGTAVKMKGGFAFKSEEGIPNSNTQLVRMGNLYQNKLDLERAPIFYPDNFSKDFSNYVLIEGDLIMSLTGTMGKEDYGFTVKVPKTNKTLLLNQRIAKFEIVDQDINKDYLKHYFLSRVFLDRLYKTAKGTKQANLSSNEMKTLYLLKPNLEEQLIIAQSLGLLESKIENHEKKKQTLNCLFKTLLHELMTGQRRVHELEFETLTTEYTIEHEPLSMVAET